MALPMRRFTLVTIVVLFALLAAAAVYQIVLVSGKPRGFVGPGLSPSAGRLILGDMVGRQRRDAEALLEDAGLDVRVEPRGGDSDIVVAQDPAAGSLVEDGTEVRLAVECVPAPCPTPPQGQEIVDPCGCVTR
ncbi:MAG TPA: PASTA domain-containing protein [Actinomycetota bacterium]|nr:PASTA domain-containing protein [Actinomycetota bacterium]